MSFNSDVRQNIATLEFGKFVEIVDDTRFPPTSVVRVQYPNDASMPAVTSVEAYPKYAVTTYISNSSIPVAMASSSSDAFGRLRTSAPLTLFDSSHRYRDNSLWCSLTAAGATCEFNANQGLMDLTVGTTSGSSITRETIKVFAYQPGKSLQILNTFVMAPSAANVVQRVGYYGQDNGMYFQLSGDVAGFGMRSKVSGSVVDTVVPMSAWNGDRMDGTGASGVVLDVTKAQIMWMDVEWLGVGTVRMGFVYNGQFVVCHSFHHANHAASTYITTASLPVRYEIYNTGATASSRTMKQICTTVISEGGYELRGNQLSVGTTIASPMVLTLASTFYPVVTIRLKASRLDAIVIPSAISLMPVTNGAFYNWKLIMGGATAGGSGTWLDVHADSSVEYRLDATSITGGRVLASGFLQGSNQGSPPLDIFKDALFRFQLERNSLTSTPYELSLVVATNNAASPVYGAMDWEEVSR